MDPAAVVAVAAAVIAVAGAVAALWTRSMIRMVAAVGGVVVGVAGVALPAGGPALAGLLALGGAGLLVPLLAAVVVVDLDGRPQRTLRPWKLLMLLPLPLLGLLVIPHIAPGLPGSSPAPLSSSAGDATDAVLLALLALAASGPAVLLLARRREAA